MPIRHPTVNRFATPVESRRSLSLGRYTLAAAAVIVVVLASLLWIWQAGEERRGVLQMPADERGALYRETRQHTDVLCREAAAQPWLDARCRSAAEFLLSFPECDAECKAFARAYTSQPAR